MLRKIIIKTLGNHEKQFIMIPVFSVLCSLVAAAVVILLVGKNPVSAFVSLLQGSGVMPKPSYAAHKNMLTDLMNMISLLTPMIFAALSVAVAFKTGLFNIGVSGQMLAAGFIATITVGYSGLPAFVAKPLVLVIGVVIGALVGAAIGWLKFRFNINEVVSCIMINSILSYVISFFINTRFVDPVSRQSKYIKPAARLVLVDTPVGGLKMDIPFCVLLAILCAFLVRILLDKTRLGYELKTVGLSPKAAKYAGIRVGRTMVTAMTVSGALAGLAGVTNYLGYYSSISPKVLSSTGFDAIAVSLLGNSNPIGIIFSSLLITIVGKGSTYMSSTVGVEQEIASVITGLILLFSACGAYIKYLVNRMDDMATAEKEVER